MSTIRRLAASAGTALLLLVAAFAIGRVLSPEDPVGASGTQDPRPPAAVATASPAAVRKILRDGQVDLLAMVDPGDHAVSGVWKVSEGVLVSPAEPEARIEIPYVPPAEYDLRIVVHRKSAEHRSFHIGLVAEGRQFLVTLDGFGEPKSAIEHLDGKPSREPGTTYTGWALKERRPLSIDCSVRRSHLTVTVEGKTFVDWQGDFKRLSLPPHWKVGDEDSLFVGVWRSRYEISEITLTPQSGTGRALR